MYDRVLSEEEKFLIDAELAGRYGLPLELANYIRCDDYWKNHGDYVSSLAQMVEVLVEAMILTEEEGEALVSAGAQSDCGDK